MLSEDEEEYKTQYKDLKNALISYESTYKQLEEQMQSDKQIFKINLQHFDQLKDQLAWWKKYSFFIPKIIKLFLTLFS